MANLLIDGFDGIVTADLASTFTPAGAQCTVVAGGRFGNGVQFNGFSTVMMAYPVSNNATLTCGFAIKFTGIEDTLQPIVGFTDAGTYQMEVRVSTTGAIYVTRAGTAIATATQTYVYGQWYFVEFKATINNTTGSYELRWDGVNVASGSGIDTQQTTNAFANAVQLGLSQGVTNGVTYIIDDLYINDGNGTKNTGFMGDGRVETLYPIAAGVYSEFTPLAGANYTNVDEVTPDAETSYVESSTVGHRDTYTFGDLVTTSGAIKAVQHSIYARKTDAGARDIAALTRRAGTDAQSANIPLGNTYAIKRVNYDQDPVAAADWTITNLNASEFGVKVTS